ncbi:SUMF1/EgtB/PvdO family nonheme iron enzyme [Sphaerotilus mobilis]|nr:SUMF1/EgtB/PvdO family nonheme iron enzyme [Sphaerotilus mobilis]
MSVDTKAGAVDLLQHGRYPSLHRPTISGDIRLALQDRFTAENGTASRASDHTNGGCARPLRMPLPPYHQIDIGLRDRPVKQENPMHPSGRGTSAGEGAALRHWRSHRALAWLTLACLLLAMLPVHAAPEGKRVALLIGNSNYAVGPLRNPANDVREMEASLLSLGFQVRKVMDTDQNQLKRAIRDFGNDAKGAAVALFYYSGHGIQSGGENYLIPLRASIDKESDYDVEAVSVSSALRQIAGARPDVTLLVLDACRDNPLASVTRSGTKGLGRMDAPTGTAIAFATAPNTTAADSGLFARVLAAELRKPGQELFDALRNTTAVVKRETGGRQEPRVSEWSITDRVFLAGTTQAIGTSPDVGPGSRHAAAPAPATAMAVPATSIPVVRADATCQGCPAMVVIPAGSFQMGSTSDEEGRSGDEGPLRTVTFAQPLAVSKNLVTRGEFAEFVNATGHRTDAELGGGCRYFLEGRWQTNTGQSWRSLMFAQTNDHPVTCVSWHDAVQYTLWLNARSALKGWRLPSEAEWEYAARAGTRTTYPWGQLADRAMANYGRDTCCGPLAAGADEWEFTSPVGHFPANAWGLHDMSGNLWQWVQDVWHDNYHGAPVDGSAWLKDGSPTERVVRGGSWGSNMRSLRTADRNKYVSTEAFPIVGFRVVRQP